MIRIQSGVDEAGRGCVLGDLYIAIACTSSEEMLKYLTDIGVTDSKKIKKKDRISMYTKIRSVCHTECFRATPEQIDKGNLNDIELLLTAKLIDKAHRVYYDFLLEEMAFKVIVDSPTENTIRYSKEIFSNLSYRSDARINVISECKADLNHVIVGAASIVAKVEREMALDRIKQKYREEFGEVGSGYPSDMKTRNFLTAYFEKYRSFPEEVRSKWGTVDEIRRKVIEKSEFKGEKE